MDSVDKTLQLIAKQIDLSKDNNNQELLKNGFDSLDNLNYETLNNCQKVLFHYYSANAWNNKKFFNRDSKMNSWHFDQEEISKELYHLRSCLNIDGFVEIEKCIFRTC